MEMNLRSTLLEELANLDQQEAQTRETIEKANIVRQDALNRLEAIGGARQMVNHLLAKLDVPPNQHNEADGYTPLGQREDPHTN